MAREAGRRAGREGGAPVFITVKRLDNKAQGRRKGGAPWGQRQKVRGTPTGSDKLGGHIPRTMSRMSGVHPAGLMFNPVGVGGIAFVANPGCAASAATLGFVVERLRRKQRSGRTIAVACLMATEINRALKIRTSRFTSIARGINHFESAERDLRWNRCRCQRPKF